MIEAMTQIGILRLMEKRSLGVIIDKYREQLPENEFVQSTEFTMGRQRKNYDEYLHSNYIINTGIRSSYIRNDGT